MYTQLHYPPAPPFQYDCFDFTHDSDESDAGSARVRIYLYMCVYTYTRECQNTHTHTHTDGRPHDTAHPPFGAPPPPGPHAAHGVCPRHAPSLLQLRLRCVALVVGWVEHIYIDALVIVVGWMGGVCLNGVRSCLPWTPMSIHRPHPHTILPQHNYAHIHTQTHTQAGGSNSTCSEWPSA